MSKHARALTQPHVWLQGNEAKVDVGLGGALELFGLTAVEVFREAGQDMKVLIGWGGDTIVVAFRGTASFANVLNDIQVSVRTSAAREQHPAAVSGLQHWHLRPVRSCPGLLCSVALSLAQWLLRLVVQAALRPSSALAHNPGRLDCEQAWQVTHPPKRGMLCNGTRPLVHRGFLASWTAKGFNSRVVERLREMVSEVPKQQRARILVTGPRRLIRMLRELRWLDIHCGAKLEWACYRVTGSCRI